MKKLFFLGAFALSAFAFANTSDVKPEIQKEEASVAVKQSASSDQKMLLLRARYVVEFDLPCGGGHMTVEFGSNYPDGSAGFINDLAYAVNSGVSQGCDYKDQYGL